MNATLNNLSIMPDNITISKIAPSLMRLWEKSLYELCSALNTAQKEDNGRQFNNEKYSSFLAELRRIGIVRDENGNFVYADKDSEWGRIKRNYIIGEDILPTEFNIAMQNRLLFKEKLPSGEPGRWFGLGREQASDATEAKLSTALSQVKNFYRENHDALATTEATEVLQQQKSPQNSILEGKQKLHWNGRVATYDSMLKKETASLEEKTKLCTDIIVLIANDIQEKTYPLSSVLHQEIVSTLKETNLVLKEVTADQILLTHYINSVGSGITHPVQTTLDKLSKSLVIFMERSIVGQTDLSSERRNISTLVNFLAVEIPKAKILANEAEIAKPDTNLELLNKEKEDCNTKINESKINSAALTKKSQELQGKETKQTADIELLSAQLKSLQEESHNAITSLQVAEAKKNKAEEILVEAENKLNAITKAYQKNEQQLKDDKSAAKDQCQELDSTIFSLNEQKKSASKDFEELNRKINSEDIRSNLATKIDQLVNSHGFLSTSLLDSIFRLRFARRHTNDAKYAENLADIRAKLSQKNNSTEEITSLIEELNLLLERITNDPEGSPERKKLVNAIISSCENNAKSFKLLNTAKEKLDSVSKDLDLTTQKITVLKSRLAEKSQLLTEQNIDSRLLEMRKIYVPQKDTVQKLEAEKTRAKEEYENVYITTIRSTKSLGEKELILKGQIKIAQEELDSTQLELAQVSANLNKSTLIESDLDTNIQSLNSKIEQRKSEIDFRVAQLQEENKQLEEDLKIKIEQNQKKIDGIMGHKVIVTEIYARPKRRRTPTVQHVGDAQGAGDIVDIIDKPAAQVTSAATNDVATQVEFKTEATASPQTEPQTNPYERFNNHKQQLIVEGTEKAGHYPSGDSIHAPHSTFFPPQEEQPREATEYKQQKTTFVSFMSSAFG